MNASKLQSDLLVLVINLDRSPERLARMTERLSQLPLTWERLPAIDGALIPVIRAEEVDEEKYKRQHGKPLARAEIGCYLSHVQAMRQFLRTDKKYLLLFEDDASPEPDFMRVIEQLLEVPEQWDVVKLSGFHNPYVIHSNHLINGYVFGVPTTRHCNTAAVLYNRKAAQQFIECMLPMSLPFDHALEQPWLYDVKLRVVKPSPVQAGDGAESTIVGTKTQKFKWYRRLGTYGFRIKNELQRLVWSVWQ